MHDRIIETLRREMSAKKPTMRELMVLLARALESARATERSTRGSPNPQVAEIHMRSLVRAELLEAIMRASGGDYSVLHTYL